MGKNNKNDDDDFDVIEYRKFLKNMFPSKHMKEKVKADKKFQKNKELVDKIKNKNKRAKQLKNKFQNDDDHQSQSESESESESEYETESESESETDVKSKNNKNNNKCKDVNIIFTLTDKDIKEN